jgi:AcrR family transcriptional regulator
VATDPPGPDRPQRQDAIRLARRMFLSRQRIDVGAVAEGLRVNRTTVYRWFGGRDQLLTAVLRSLSDDTLKWAERQTHADGLERVFEVMRLYAEAIGRHPAYRHFLRREPEAAARVLFGGDLRRPVVEAYERLLVSERDSLSPDVDPAMVALAIVRCGEVFLYGDQIGASDPDPDETMEIVRLILDGAVATRARD